jgi:hypothetical protein
LTLAAGPASKRQELFASQKRLTLSAIATGGICQWFASAAFLFPTEASNHIGFHELQANLVTP